MWFVDGLDDGRVAVLTKIHHSIIDGQSGTDVATLLFDLSPDPPPADEPPPYKAEAPPSSAQIVARSSLEVIVAPLRLVRYGRQVVEQGVAVVPMALGKTPPAMPFRALIAQVPVSVRTEASRGDVGTQVASMFVSLATDVAGPPVDFYVAGARIEHVYPLGPLLYGGGMNITFFSNVQTIDVGMITCPELVPDAWAVADRFVPVLQELVAAVATAIPNSHINLIDDGHVACVRPDFGRKVTDACLDVQRKVELRAASEWPVEQ